MPAVATQLGLPLSKAGRLFQTRPNFRTLHRWIRHGIVTHDGRLVKLRSTVFMGKYYVSADDAAAFVADQQPRVSRSKG